MICLRKIVRPRKWTLCQVNMLHLFQDQIYLNLSIWIIFVEKHVSKRTGAHDLLYLLTKMGISEKAILKLEILQVSVSNLFHKASSSVLRRYAIGELKDIQYCREIPSVHWRVL